ncbi:MAG: universal stress protein [Candidatus Omnitrophota bacterium]
MKILICTNGQEHAEQALNFAGQLFGQAKPGITVLSVTRRLTPYPQTEKKWLQRAKNILANYDLEAQTKIREGYISDEIIRESREGNYDLVVIGSRGYSEILVGVTEVILGDIAQYVTLKAETSLLVVKEPKPLHKVLICTDGSVHSQAALHFWGRLAIPNQPKINIINVVPEIYGRFKDLLEPVAESQLDMLGTLPGKRTEYLYRAKDILGKYNIPAKVKLREGQAAEEILKEAENDYDLIIMGTGGRKGNKKDTWGRQTRRVIRQAKIPVLAIRTKD